MVPGWSRSSSASQSESIERGGKGALSPSLWRIYIQMVTLLCIVKPCCYYVQPYRGGDYTTTTLFFVSCLLLPAPENPSIFIMYIFFLSFRVIFIITSIARMKRMRWRVTHYSSVWPPTITSLLALSIELTKCVELRYSLTPFMFMIESVSAVDFPPMYVRTLWRYKIKWIYRDWGSSSGYPSGNIGLVSPPPLVLFSRNSQTDTHVHIWTPLYRFPCEQFRVNGVVPYTSSTGEYFCRSKKEKRGEKNTSEEEEKTF